MFGGLRALLLASLRDAVLLCGREVGHQTRPLVKSHDMQEGDLLDIHRMQAWKTVWTMGRLG